MLELNHPNQNEINIFAQGIKKKTKRLYKNNAKRIIKQAIHISPAYRDFVNKLLSSSTLSIKPYTGGYCSVVECGERNNFSKRRKVKICVDFTDPDCFTHELGHYCDFLFGGVCSFSSNIVVMDGKTLDEIFTEEFNEKEPELYKTVMGAYARNIDSNIYKGAYDIFTKYFPLYRKLSILITPEQRRKVHKELYESGFVEIYYQLVNKKCYSVVEQKYAPIMDALSSKHDITNLYLRGHSIEYYKINKELLVQEFFAHAFSDKVTANHTRFDSLIKLMPKSFNAFERLFVLIYDHIMNNKRFTDMPILLRPTISEQDIDEVEEEIADE